MANQSRHSAPVRSYQAATDRSYAAWPVLTEPGRHCYDLLATAWCECHSPIRRYGPNRQEHVNTRKPNRGSVQRGVGLVETMIGLVIGMLMVLMIFQVYQVNEGQKRTVTGGSDAQQSAGYGLFMIGRDVSIAGNGIASSAVALDGCALLRPVPVVITAGATDNDPDSITAFYGGSSSLSTPVAFLGNATIASA